MYTQSLALFVPMPALWTEKLRLPGQLAWISGLVVSQAETHSHFGSQSQDPWPSLGGSKCGDGHLVALSAIAVLSWESSGLPDLTWAGASGLLEKGLVGVCPDLSAHHTLAEFAN